MLDDLQGMVKTLDEMLSSVDPALLHPREAVRLLGAACDVEQRAASLKTLLADRAADSGEWSRQGYHSPEDWLAHKTGTGYGQAAGTLDASVKLTNLPELENAVRAGELSGPKLNELARAATPQNEKRLLEATKKQNFRDVKRTCAQEKAKARSEEQEAARHERIHKERCHKSWADDDGGYRYEGKTTAAMGARIDAAIAAEAERVFKEAYDQGRRESSAAYRADALANLICGGGATVDTTVVIRVDESRLRGEEGTCDATGTGAVPVSVAIGAILAGAFVKVVAHNGTDISKVAHPRRHIPAELKTAILERDNYTCVRPGCGATTHLEIHHYKVAHAKGGPMAYWNAYAACPHDHDLLTHGGHRLEGGPGNWKWIPPP